MAKLASRRPLYLNAEDRDLLLEALRTMHARDASAARVAASIEAPPRKGYHLVRCEGEAHSNPHIDNCSDCAPRWGWCEVPDAAASE